MLLGRRHIDLLLSTMLSLVLFFLFNLFNIAFCLVINIIHTNDVHGNFESTSEVIGLDLVKGIKNQTENSILIDAGDAVQRSALCSLKQNIVTSLFNVVGYDLRIPGNHDFDFSWGQVVENAKNSSCPMLAANVIDKSSGKSILNGINGNNGENYITEFKGKKIGFFGLVTTETLSITPPKNVSGIEFLDEITIAKEQVKKLKNAGVDLIVAVTHMGVGASTKYTTEKLAQEVSGIDIIIDGHSHTKMTKRVNSTVIQQTGAKAHNVGMIQINFDNGNSKKIDAYVMSAEDANKKFKADPVVALEYDNCLNEIKSVINKVIGYIDQSLFGGAYRDNNVARGAFMNLGSAICDAMMDYASSLASEDEELKKYKDISKVVYFHGGALRDTLKAGFVNYGDIMRVFMYEHNVSFQIITPKALFGVLERGLGKIKYLSEKSGCFQGLFGGFPQIAGMSLDFDISKEPYNYETKTGGERVVSLYLTDSNGKRQRKLNRTDDETQLMFVSNESMLHEFPSIANIEPIKIGKKMVNVFADFLRKICLRDGKMHYSVDNNRVKLINNNKFSHFDSTIIVKNSEGVISCTELDVQIDDNKSFKFTTDENGQVFIKNLETGSHVIKFECANLRGEVLVSNFCNIKDTYVVLSDKSISDFRSVENLIGQISHDLSDYDKSLIKFARRCYDMLSESAKKRVINYCKLERAEEEISGAGVEFIKKNKEILIYSVVFISSLAIFCCMLIIKNKRKKNEVI